MSVTDFGRQQPEQKLAWGHKAYEEYVEKFFFTKMLGQGASANGPVLMCSVGIANAGGPRPWMAHGWPVWRIPAQAPNLSGS